MRARIYARLIIKGRMTLTEVSEKYPTYLEEVKQSLIELGHPELTE
ncbi:CD1375 family protein [Bilifractor porci]|nr:CD1375 family protein [Bilifractor porci]